MRRLHVNVSDLARSIRFHEACSDKSGVTDPPRVRRETFFTLGEATADGKDASSAAMAAPAESSLASCAGAPMAAAATYG
ncbi:hypothetical protein [Phenylobacterium sp.]|uniref:hypothetical protein n=1 Tax=Phenylobacterium sp. TaxID=1871053 RepID=UPI00286AF737|nr:hypothetical protein [Phenylobacterium sp.]